MLAFIDDSGDEGTGGSGSRWLVFGCSVVANHDIAVVKDVCDEACAAIGRGRHRWLHFRDLPHDDRHGAIDILNKAPWSGLIVGSDTTLLLPGSRLSNPRAQYHYAARYLVERISRFGTAIGEEATLYFEMRRNFNLNEFKGYIQRLIGDGVPQIDPAVISPDRFFEMAKGTDTTLCIADGLAHAGYRALEPHRHWGRHEKSYFDAFFPKLWRGPAGEANIHRWGFTLMPTTEWGGRFIRDYPWIKDLPRT